MGALKSARCSRGHKMAGDNLVQRKNGGRECRKCKMLRAEAARKTAKEAKSA